jgi:hypothetical protein
LLEVVYELYTIEVLGACTRGKTMHRTRLAQILISTSLVLAFAACADDRDDDKWNLPPMNPSGDDGAGDDGGADDGGDDGGGDDDGGDGGGDDGSDGGDGGDDGGDDGGNTGDDGGDTGDDGGDTGDDGGDTGDDGGQTEDPPGESPYEGGWDIGNCQDSIQGTASQPGQIGVGDVLYDWTLPDQFGDQVRFYDFCHKVIYYVVVAGW